MNARFFKVVHNTDICITQSINQIQMEEKLEEILDNYEEKIERYETQVKKLASKMDFCKAHNFEEEFRIANVEYQAVNMCVYSWREMHKEIRDVINAWLS